MTGISWTYHEAEQQLDLWRNIPGADGKPTRQGATIHGLAAELAIEALSEMFDRADRYQEMAYLRAEPEPSGGIAAHILRDWAIRARLLADELGEAADDA